MDFNPFVYGKNQQGSIVGMEVFDRHTDLYVRNGQVINVVKIPDFYWLLASSPFGNQNQRLAGNLTYKWVSKFKNEREFRTACGIAKNSPINTHVVYNPKEMSMLRNGTTFYKGMTPRDVSVLSFDIETTGFDPNATKLLLISATYRLLDKIERRLFSYEEFRDERTMVGTFCAWVRDCDPDILLGHNILGFDLPYLKQKCGGNLDLGRGESSLAIFSKYTSSFRKDGSQSYDYNNVIVPGREVIDTFHLAIKYDLARNYESYSLKSIIRQEGLERADRQHYDASTIAERYMIPEEWEKIKTYSLHDADDPLALFDLMIPSFFYFCQSIPKTLQQVVSGASGSQVDSFMKRSYLQMGHSLPEASPPVAYEGAISYGNAGIYNHVNKVDVASLYPSIILQYEIYNRSKDPRAHFLKMVQIFTEERLKNKRLAKETGERRYKDLEQSQKIIINSAYGFMGAPGLLFNSPVHAAEVTRHGREILQAGIDWVNSRGYRIVNVDTDSFSYTTGTQADDFDVHIEEINSLFPEKIRWENDGQYPKMIVVKAKNYIMYDGKKIKIKGSGLKATMKERALTTLVKEVIEALVFDRESTLIDIYEDYVKLTAGGPSFVIGYWTSKKTITKSVLEPKRTNESRVLDAIRSAGVRVSEGDKIRVFFKTKTELALEETFDGTFDRPTLLNKIFQTMKIFSTIIDIKQFPNFKLKKNQRRLNELDRTEARSDAA
jgi:DNA polymerase elongation subunit (family B)